jgi:hypothetical protein
MQQLLGPDNDSNNHSTKTTQSTKAKLAEALLAMIEQMRLMENKAPPDQIFISPDPKVRAPALKEHPVTAAASMGPQI